MVFVGSIVLFSSPFSIVFFSFLGSRNIGDKLMMQFLSLFSRFFLPFYLLSLLFFSFFFFLQINLNVCEKKENNWIIGESEVFNKKIEIIFTFQKRKKLECHSWNQSLIFTMNLPKNIGDTLSLFFFIFLFFYFFFSVDNNSDCVLHFTSEQVWAFQSTTYNSLKTVSAMAGVTPLSEMSSVVLP